MHENKIITNLKNIIIKYTRGYFSNIENYDDFTNFDFTDVFVFDKQPNELRQFPSFLVTTASGNFINSGLGDVAEEIFDDDGVCIGCRYCGIMEFPITIETATKTTLERDVVSDLLSFMLRVYARRQLEAEGFLIKDIRYGGESEINYENEKIYISTLNFTVWTTWYRDVKYMNVKEINIDVDVNKDE